MPFDALTAAAIRQELAEKLVGGRVQNILMPGPLTVSLEVYRPDVGRTHLILSAHPQHARAHIISSPPTRDPRQHPPLLLLLRKYVRGGTLLDVARPRHERILALSIAKRFYPDKHQEYHFERDFGSSTHPYAHPTEEGDEHSDEQDGEGEEPAQEHGQGQGQGHGQGYRPDQGAEAESAPVVQVQIIVEVMGRLSNIVLVDHDGTILDSIKRIPPGLSRYRTILPHHPYVPPPAQDKRDPVRTTVNALALELLRVAETDEHAEAWRGLVNGLAGVSPTLAREVTYQAFGDAAIPATAVAHDPARLGLLLDRLHAMFALEETGLWQPVVAWHAQADGPDQSQSQSRRPVEFAPYPLTHLAAGGAQIVHYGSMSEAIETYYASIESLSGHAALRAQVRAELEQLRAREERRLAALREELHRAESLEELRRKGEYILAFMHTLTPGQRLLHIPEEHLTIELDPALTPVENAQAMFREYRKARSALEGLPEKIAGAEMRVRFYDELLTSLELASTYDEIRAVQAESGLALNRPTERESEQGLQGKNRGRARAGRPAQKLPRPLRLQTRRGAPMLVGRTAGQSDAATFHLSAPDDLWFHVLGAPGAHVILRTAGGITQEDIREAAATAAGYSKLRDEPQVDVVYTEKRHVRRVPGAPPGLVTYRNEQVIRVSPARPPTAAPGQ